MEERADFGELLRQYRLAAGLTQEALAELTGLSARGISDLERGARRTPRPGTVRRLAQAFGLSDDERVSLQAFRTRQAAARSTRTRRQIPSSLPAPLTGFVGRERELADVSQLLDSSRLLTLIGTGGVGKSRLALEAGWLRMGRHPDGVWLVDLAPLTDPNLLPRAVASVLGVIEGPRRSLEAALAWVLRERDLLVILDNCEHLIETCAGLVERLLRSCPVLRVIATSREPLGIVGEQLYDVAPLSVPAEEERDPARLGASEAARFFADRARLARPDFSLTDDVCEAVTSICRRLDGIPLALELAAARLRTMSAAEIAGGLDDRFALLTGGRRTAEPRHRTLRGMVDWSWELLSEPERVLLRRLAVFAGGWTLDAVTQVCGGRPTLPGDPGFAVDVADVLGSLVERSLVVSDDWRGSRRYRLLDTIRSYAEERLREAGEDSDLRSRHQDWYLRLLEASEAEAVVDQLAWLARLDAELENIRTALDRCRVESGTAERALQAGFGIWMYWDIRGHGDEARRRFDELLALLPPGPPTAGRVIGQCFYVHVLGSLGHLEPAVRLFEEARELARRLGDRAASSWFGWLELQFLAFAGDPSGPALARARLAEHCESPSPLGDWCLPWLSGVVLLRAGELDEAAVLLRLAVRSPIQHVQNLAADFLGMVAFRGGDIDVAEAHFRQALAGSARFRDLRPCAAAVEHLADVAGASGRWERAARLYGASAMLLDLSNKIPLPVWQLEPERTAAACREALGEEEFSAAFASGQAMTTDQAFTYALADVGAGQTAWTRE